VQVYDLDAMIQLVKRAASGLVEVPHLHPETTSGQLVGNITHDPFGATGTV
jgi:hypothetical protein